MSTEKDLAAAINRLADAIELLAAPYLAASPAPGKQPKKKQQRHYKERPLVESQNLKQ